MKRSLLLSIGIMALLFTACNKAEYGITPDNSNTTIKAVMDADETKSTVSNYSFYWSAGDKINVWYANVNTTRPVEFKLSGNGGVTSGTFTGTTVEGETCTGYAVYPSGSHSMSDGTITVNMPDVYGDNNTEYVENTNAAMIAGPTNNAAATNSETTVPSLSFKHVGGVLAFTIKNVPVTANQFVFTANMPITGDFTVANDKITATEPAQDETVTNNTVTINFKPLTAAKEAMTFYVPLPTGTYKGFKVEVKKSDGTNAMQPYETSTENTLSRAGLANMTLVITDVNAGTPAQEISTTAALKNALINGGSYVLTSDLTIDEQLSMNSASTQTIINLQNKTLTLQTSNYGIVNYAGSLILKNGNIVSDNPQWALYNKGVTELNNITFTLSNYGIYTKGVWADGKTIQDYKETEAAVKFTVDGGSITSTATASSGNYYAVYADNYSLVTMKNTTITGSGSAGGLNLNCAAANLSGVTINGGTTGTAHDVWVRTGLLTTDNSTSYDNYLYSASGNYGYTEVNGKYYGPTANQPYDSIEALENALQIQ